MRLVPANPSQVDNTMPSARPVVSWMVCDVSQIPYFSSGIAERDRGILTLQIHGGPLRGRQKKPRELAGPFRWN